MSQGEGAAITTSPRDACSVLRRPPAFSRLAGRMEASVSEQDLSHSDEQAADGGSAEPTAEQQAQLKALDDALAKFEGLKRWSDVIKTLVSKAELVRNRSEKIALYSRAGDLYLEKSSNQAEAIKCYARL